MTEKYFWQFDEENDWEGETWTVFFTANEEQNEKIIELRELNQDSAYVFSQIDNFPETFNDIHESEDYWCEDHGDECDEDCEEEYGDTGYFPREQFIELTDSLLDDAIDKLKREVEDNPLYKLGLFR